MAGKAVYYFMGAHEIRVRLGGISRQRVHQLTTRADFPAPVADLMQGKVWHANDVEEWIKTRPSRRHDVAAEETP
ncbi:helix-turn-helix transcriptional regulator [Actinoplanes sp. G11-F43]|uniref:helix-turn-helix transcriptional regulator n=1 Tax=Actinoplanes sp. G11-F43 TaxID=3424130 RepID=UPI003D3548E9